MIRERLNMFIGTSDISIAETMERFVSNAGRILFIVDEQEKLIGSVSDGDIRRWILKTGSLTHSVDHAMMKEPKFLFSKEREQAKAFPGRWICLNRRWRFPCAGGMPIPDMEAAIIFS